MSYRATYFVQDCPTCGRQLQVRVEYLGKNVKCQHCGAAFSAQPPDSRQQAHESSDELMARADELLKTAEEMRGPLLEDPRATDRWRTRV